MLLHADYGEVGGVFDGELEGDLAFLSGFQVEAPGEFAVFFAGDFASGFVLGADFFLAGARSFTITFSSCEVGSTSWKVMRSAVRLWLVRVIRNS